MSGGILRPSIIVFLGLFFQDFRYGAFRIRCHKKLNLLKGNSERVGTRVKAPPFFPETPAPLPAIALKEEGAEDHDKGKPGQCKEHSNRTHESPQLFGACVCGTNAQHTTARSCAITRLAKQDLRGRWRTLEERELVETFLRDRKVDLRQGPERARDVHKPEEHDRRENKTRRNCAAMS